MPALHPKENWMVTGRWEAMDDLYKLKDVSERDFALGATHEEIIVPLMKKFITSYKDLPIYAYQFQSKFRMELRSKSGILRGREFIMKDLYSFHLDEEDLNEYYEKANGIYTMLCDAGVEVLYDDRDLNPGQKFADADLIGVSYQLIVSEKNLKENKIEIKKRASNSTAFIDLDKGHLVEYFKSSRAIPTLSSSRDLNA